MNIRRDVFQVIADLSRRAIVMLLASQTLTAGAIAGHFNSARSTISKHIQILTECGLVTANPQGREIYYSLGIDKMKEIDLWMQQLHTIWDARFDRLDDYLKKLQNN